MACVIIINTKGVNNLSEKAEVLNQWNEQLIAYEMIKIAQMPDIDLYMDQVITFITKQLSIFSKEEPDKIITPSMINNYVKDGIIPRPNNKKYNKTHLISILMLCVFKQILPINDITIFIDKEQEKTNFGLYEEFSQMQNNLVQKVSNRLSASLQETEEGNETEQLKQLSMEMIIEANILSAFAKKIIHTIEEKPKSHK